MAVIDFFIENWVNLALIIVGLSAVWIYKAQEKGKLRDAASLIVLQIDELQKRVSELQSYITDKGLNFAAFYESLPLIDVNYWNKYKHLFIRKMDNKSFDNLNKFYQYVTSMQEQQELMKNLQKQFFFVKQSAISNWEFSFIVETLKEVFATSVSPQQLQSICTSSGALLSISIIKKNEIISIIIAIINIMIPIIVFAIFFFMFSLSIIFILSD